MKTYLVPVAGKHGGHDYNYLTPVYAGSPQEAYSIATTLFIDRIVKEQCEYESYKGNLPGIPYIFPISDKDDIIKASLNTKEGCEDNMAYFKVNWNKYTEKLSQIAAQENWSNNTYPNKGILANYIVKTYNKLTSEKKIVIGQDYALFNTGLFNKYFDPLYAYQSGTEISFLTGYELSSIGITEYVRKAHSFRCGMDSTKI